MLKLLLSVVIEVFVAVSLAGLILALAIPLLNSKDLLGGPRGGALPAGQRASPLSQTLSDPRVKLVDLTD